MTKRHHHDDLNLVVSKRSRARGTHGDNSDVAERAPKRPPKSKRLAYLNVASQRYLPRLRQSVSKVGGILVDSAAHATHVVFESEADARVYPHLKRVHFTELIGSDESSSAEIAEKQQQQPRLSDSMSSEIQKIDAAHSSANNWDVRFRPTSLSQVLGAKQNLGMVQRLEDWLTHFRPQSEYRMAVLHGPPGSGKTSVVQLLAELLGYQVLTIGNGDQRTRNMLQLTITEASESTDLGHFDGFLETRSAPRKMILMEETSSLPSSQTIQQLIQRSRIPLVCIASDCKDPRIKICKQQTMFLAMSQPEAEDVCARVCAALRSENAGGEVPMADVRRVIITAGLDVRQVYNTMQVMCRTNAHDGDHRSQPTSTVSSACLSSMSAAFHSEGDMNASTKDFTRGISDAAARMFSSSLNVTEKFADYTSEPSMMSLFVQENYVKNLKSERLTDDLLDTLCYAADSITVGDVLDHLVHSENHTCLHDNHALMACVVPAFVVAPFKTESAVTFPTCLGKQATMMRRRQTLIEMRSHLDKHVMVPFQDIRVSFVPPLRCILGAFMGKDHVDSLIAFAEKYCMSKDDVSMVLETLVLYANQRSILPPRLRNALSIQKRGQKLQSKK